MEKQPEKKEEDRYGQVVFCLQLAVNNETKAQAVQHMKDLLKAMIKANDGGLETHISLGVVNLFKKKGT